MIQISKRGSRKHFAAKEAEVLCSKRRKRANSWIFSKEGVKLFHTRGKVVRTRLESWMLILAILTENLVMSVEKKKLGTYLNSLDRLLYEVEGRQLMERSAVLFSVSSPPPSAAAGCLLLSFQAFSPTDSTKISNSKDQIQNQRR